MKYRRLLALIASFLCGYIVHYCQNVLYPSKEDGANYSQVNLLENQTAFLVIFVLSSVKNIGKRKAIRDTWAKDLQPSVRLYFVINVFNIPSETSLMITEEQNCNRDLLLFRDIEDSFLSLTKSILNVFIWVSNGKSGNVSFAQKTFTDFRYVLKCDDDSYVRVDNLVQELKGGYSDEMLYWGFFDGRARVKKSGKYKELSWNICDTYIPYALGGGYVLAQKPVQYIARNAKFLRQYQNEDTSVGAWLASLNGLKREHDPRFDTEYLSRGCHQSYLITHKHDSTDLRRLHNNLKTTGLLCSKEYRTRLSYKYDWNVMPSKCCSRTNPAIP